MQVARKRKIVSKDVTPMSGGRWSETVTWDDGRTKTTVWINEIHATANGEMISIKKKVDPAADIADKVSADIVANRGGEGETIWVKPEEKSGYVVGGKIPELVFAWDLSADIVSDLVSAHFKAHGVDVASADCVGWWRYKDNIHVDVNDWVVDRTLAVALGRAREQISIWDVANGCEIVL